jgi:hypothetical protein
MTALSIATWRLYPAINRRANVAVTWQYIEGFIQPVVGLVQEATIT